MYDELYEIWKRGQEAIGLAELPADFYSKVADYLTKLKEESRMLDNRTVKARLLKNEMRNVRRMLRELTQSRYRKLVRAVAKGDKTTLDALTSEEEKIVNGVLPFAEAYHTFVKNLLRGRIVTIGVGQERRTVVLRFLKDIPAIIGSDMKPYGPFSVEDVASLPNENAKILVSQGLAESVEVG